MEAIEQQMHNLQIELDKKKNEMLEISKYNETRNVSKNLDILEDAIETRKTHVQARSYYSKSCIVAKFIDKDMIDPLQAIYNLLFTFNE